MDINISDKITRVSGSGKFKLPFNWRYKIVKIRNVDYSLSYLDSVKSNKGGNSSVFLLVNPEHRNDESQHLVIKICNRANDESDLKYKRKFQREILAMARAESEKKNYIIKHFNHGNVMWQDKSFPYYTMEKADCDLSNFLTENELSTDQKILLCLNIVRAFKDLHSLNMYHRDIKHDNILMFGSECKVSDLGLMRFREDDLEFIREEKGDRIGAFGWESPETMNKYLTENKAQLSFKCDIDDQSDIFQLGKLFWFVFQGNLPIGQIILADFLVNDKHLFEIIFWMLQHGSGQRRPASISEVEEHLNLVAKRYSLI